MTTIIVCAFVVVFIGLLSEIRVSTWAMENERLKAMIRDRDERYKSLHTLSENMLEDYETMYEVMADHFGEDEIDNLCAMKKCQLMEDGEDD